MCDVAWPSSTSNYFRLYSIRRTYTYIPFRPSFFCSFLICRPANQGVSIAPLPIKCKVDIAEASYDALCIRSAIAVSAVHIL